MIEYPVLNNFKVERCAHGLIQGNSLSPFLSNLYLGKFDFFISRTITKHFYRYADDIVAFFRTPEEAYNFLSCCRRELGTCYSMTINEKKSGVYPIESIQYLGYSLISKDGSDDYEIVKLKKEKQV